MKKFTYLFFFALIIFIYFITIDINLPFVGPNATNFNVYSLIAHNFNRFGYVQTKLTPLISVSDKYPQNPSYFFHHPTLLSFIESVLFKIFGETFWAARLSVILFGVGSLIFVYLIGKNLIDKKFALISVTVFSIIPASTVFGKLIGQEPLVLFFLLSSFYLSIIFLKNKDKKYFYLLILSLILGILSDWPGVLISFCLIPLFWKEKKMKEGIILTAVSLLTLALLVAYVIALNGGFTDLGNAIAHRSFSGLLSISNWPLLWIKTWIVRVLVYFNPAIIVLSTVYLLNIYKNKTKIKNTELVILGLLGFALIHEILYLQAVFSHNYLIYYLLPFVTFSSSFVLYKLAKTKKVLVSIFIILSFFYLVGISYVKNLQVRENLWRYQLAGEISKHVNKYETIAISSADVVDSDMLWYPFLINWKVEPISILDSQSNYKHYVFTCVTDCSGYKLTLEKIKGKYTFERILAPNSEVYIFSLNNSQKLSGKTVKIQNTNTDDNFAKKGYESIRSLLNLPSI